MVINELYSILAFVKVEVVSIKTEVCSVKVAIARVAEHNLGATSVKKPPTDRIVEEVLPIYIFPLHVVN